MSTRRGRGLGRGLASLIPDSTFGDDSTTGSAYRLVPLDEVKPNPHQPRESFDPDDLESLAESIRHHGVLTPLVVRKEDGHYILIAGERRLRASALAGLSEVPVVVRDASSDANQLELALVENLQRADLDVIESARGYRRLVDEYGYTQAQVAERVGKDRSTVANALRLLKLPPMVVDSLRSGEITAGHARALLPLVDRPELKRLLGRVINEELNVRDTERAVSRVLDDKPRAKEQTEPYAEVQELLTRTLTTAVQIKSRRDGSGKIVIDYSSVEELDRLVQQLRGDQ